MQAIVQDVRYALRALSRNPSFSIAAVLTLALGIGATTAITSVVYAMLLRPLPLRDAGRLVALAEVYPQAGDIEVSYPDYLDWRSRTKTFEDLAAWSFRGYKDTVLVAGGGEPEEVRASLVSPNFFPLLGLVPKPGRGFLADEDNPRNNHVAVLSHRLWQRRFGRDSHLIGGAIQLNGESFTVIGVLPRGQQFPFDSEIFLPLSLLGEGDRTSRTYHPVNVIGRLRSGAGLEQARSELATIAAALAQAFPTTNGHIGVHLTPFRELLVGHLRAALLALFGAVALVLLIACANVANLLLVRALARGRELSLRSALGAGRGRLVRQFLTESLVLSALGTACGILLAAAALPLARVELARFSGESLAGSEPVALSLPVLGFTILLAVAAGIAFSVLPSLRSVREGREGRGGASDALRQGERAGTGGGYLARGVLAAGEIALAVILLLGAALLIRSFTNLLRVDPGFRTGHVLSAQIALPRTLYKDGGQVQSFYQQLLGRLEKAPGIRAAAVTNVLPLTASHSESRFLVQGEPPPQAGNFPFAQVRFVSPSYFETLGLRVVQGRGFEEHDLTDGNAAIVNQAFVRRYLRQRNPVSSQLLLGVVGPRPPIAIPVAGVVTDARDLGIDTEAEPEIYFAGFNAAATLLVRTDADPRGAISYLRQAVRALDRNQPIYQVKAMDEVLADSLARPRLMAALLGGFAVLALVLAAVGIYGVLAYLVAQRRRDIGVRMALGAHRGEIMRLILGQGLLLVLAGEVAGLVGGLLLGKQLSGLLFGVQAHDAGAILESLLALGLVGLLAVALPAWRAARLDPVATLRL